MNLTKKKVTILGVPLTVLVLGLVLALFLTASSPNKSWHTVYEGAIAAGVPDAYGNAISIFRVYQYSGGVWAAVGGDVSAATYTAGVTVTIPSNLPTGLMTMVVLNRTFASDASTAMARVRIYITISGGVGSSYMVASSAVDATTYWVVTLYYPSVYPFATYWTPATDVTYTVTLAYQAYY